MAVSQCSSGSFWFLSISLCFEIKILYYGYYECEVLQCRCAYLCVDMRLHGQCNKWQRAWMVNLISCFRNFRVINNKYRGMTISRYVFFHDVRYANGWRFPCLVSKSTSNTMEGPGAVWFRNATSGCGTPRTPGWLEWRRITRRRAKGHTVLRLKVSQ